MPVTLINKILTSIRRARNENNIDPAQASYPLVHGFPILSTRGHLITITGFTKIDGKEYVCVNDSAAKSDAEAKRMYLVDEFDAAWATSGRIAYTTNDSDGATYNPLQRLPSVLFKTKNTQIIDSIEYSELQLKYKGKIIDLSNSNAKTIMVSKDGGAYQYITPDSRANLWFANNTPSGSYSFLIIAKDNKEYTSKILWTNEFKKLK